MQQQGRAAVSAAPRTGLIFSDVSEIFFFFLITEGEIIMGALKGNSHMGRCDKLAQLMEFVCNWIEIIKSINTINVILVRVLCAALCPSTEKKKHMESWCSLRDYPIRCKPLTCFHPPTTKKPLCAQIWSRRRTNTTDRHCCAISSPSASPGICCVFNVFLKRFNFGTWIQFHTFSGSLRSAKNLILFFPAALRKWAVQGVGVPRRYPDGVEGPLQRQDWLSVRRTRRIFFREGTLPRCLILYHFHTWHWFSETPGDFGETEQNERKVEKPCGYFRPQQGST